MSALAGGLYLAGLGIGGGLLLAAVTVAVVYWLVQ